jgi:Tfp pilus assembly PilM family ATPase
VRTIALAGNGSRLNELPAMIERATAVRVHAATIDSGVSPALAPDVLRAAGPDWCLAYGLALWAGP